MYSPDGRKEWYIEECKAIFYEDSTAGLMERIFQSTELEEKTFEKDVCDFTDAEVVDLFKSFNSKSRVRLKTNAWYLSRYHQWCYDKGLTQKIDDAFDDRTIENIIKDIVTDDMLLDSYFTKKDLLELIELDPDYINRMIIVGIYYGIKGDDLVDLINLKITDLNEEEKTVTLISGRKAFIDDYFIHTMKMANLTDTYFQNNASMNGKKPNQTTYVKNQYVLRSCVHSDEYDESPVKLKFITQRIQRFKKEFGASFISVSTLFKNGMINYIREKYEAQGISLKTALTYNDGTYLYDKETEKHIAEFGSKTTARIIRRELKDIIDKI